MFPDPLEPELDPELDPEPFPDAAPASADPPRASATSESTTSSVFLTLSVMTVPPFSLIAGRRPGNWRGLRSGCGRPEKSL
jgi:hypothetical protein